MILTATLAGEASLKDSWKLLCDGELHRAKLQLEVLAHASPGDLTAQVLLVDVCLELSPEAGALEEAVEVAR